MLGPRYTRREDGQWGGGVLMQEKKDFFAFLADCTCCRVYISVLPGKTNEPLLLLTLSYIGRSQ